MADRTKIIQLDRSEMLTGSVHQHSSGYGPGVRVLTHRNIMTLPKSVPRYRVQPDTARFIADSTSKRQIGNDDMAMKRNADQIKHQVSGEYGRYLVDGTSSLVKANTGRFEKRSSGNSKTKFTDYPTQSCNLGSDKAFYEPMKTERYNANILRKTQPIELYRNPTTMNSARSNIGWTDSPSGSGRISQAGLQNTTFSPASSPSKSPKNKTSFLNTTKSFEFTPEKKEQYLKTLMKLDPIFSKHNRKDLVAASSPSKDSNIGVFCSTSNYRNAQIAGQWSDSLR